MHPEMPWSPGEGGQEPPGAGPPQPRATDVDLSRSVPACGLTEGVVQIPESIASTHPHVA